MKQRVKIITETCTENLEMRIEYFLEQGYKLVNTSMCLAQGIHYMASMIKEED